MPIVRYIVSFSDLLFNSRRTLLVRLVLWPTCVPESQAVSRQSAWPSGRGGAYKNHVVGDGPRIIAMFVSHRMPNRKTSLGGPPSMPDGGPNSLPRNQAW